MAHLRISQAAELLGVSTDTVRRLLDTGRIAQAADVDGPRAVDRGSLAAFMASQAPPASAPHQSARNRFPGIVIRVERDGVMALVEVQAGPHRVTSLMSRESADELALEPGVLVAGVVKSTNVVIELDDAR